MAYLIFNLNDFSGIHQMAENNSIMDQNKNFHNEHRSIVEIDNTDYLNFKKGIKDFVSCDGSNVIWTSAPAVSYSTAELFSEDIKHHLNITENWLTKPRTQNKPMRSLVISFRDYLKNINPSSVITEGNPLESTVIKYVMDQGENAFHPLELL
mgnify:FL=1